MSESAKDRQQARIAPAPVIPSTIGNPKFDPRLSQAWPRHLVLLHPYPPWAPQLPVQPQTIPTNLQNEGQGKDKPANTAKPNADIGPDVTSDLTTFPKIDMLFGSEDEAYEFYNAYAECAGFFVRRSTLWTTSKNIITRRTFVCSREGFREKKKGAKEAKCPRPETRIGCPACLTIRLTSNGKYRVTEFVPNHNHPLATLTTIHTLRTKKLRKKARAVRANLSNDSVNTPEFETEDEAYEFYSMYAGKIGFSVRRASMTVGPDNLITRRMFVCSKEGFRERKKGAKRVKKPRPETRTGCPACMVIRLGQNSKYQVTEFVTYHNHQLTASSSSDLVMSEKIEIGGDDLSDRSGNDDSAPKQENLDLKNFKNTRVKRVKITSVGDVGATLECLQKMQSISPSFFYAVRSDENDRITNFFWADAKSIIDFMHFGDVVCFDTGYRVHGYGRPLAIFTGLNHHKQTVVFGSALMYEESVDSFKWVFDSFKKAMNGKQPKTVLTDRCQQISEAVVSNWYGTAHRYCVWQIYQNALEQLSQAFHGSRTLGFDFGKCIFDCEEEEEFLLAWREMLEKYDLKDNKWLAHLFNEREKWALVYGRDSFYGDLKSVQQKENLNTEIKSLLFPEKDILTFFDQYEKLIEERRFLEIQTDISSNNCTKKPPSMRIPRQAASVYTPSAYKMFEREFELYMDCMLYNSGEVGTLSEYKVTVEESSKDHFVKFDSLDGSVSCTCKKFEFIGIPCRHMLKVLDTRNIKELPPQLISKRWRKDAKFESLTSGGNFAFLLDSQLKRYNYLCRVFGMVANRASKNTDSYLYMEGQSGVILDQIEQVLQERPSDLSALTVENIVNGGLHSHANFIGGTSDGPLTFPFTLNAGTLDYR